MSELTREQIENYMALPSTSWKAAIPRDKFIALCQMAIKAQTLQDWLDNNTTFYDVDADWPVEGHNIPVLAQVSQRIWYHATDNTKDYPFSAVIDAAKESK
jgi:hypothetical protein